MMSIGMLYFMELHIHLLKYFFIPLDLFISIVHCYILLYLVLILFA